MPKFPRYTDRLALSGGEELTTSHCHSMAESISFFSSNRSNRRRCERAKLFKNVRRLAPVTNTTASLPHLMANSISPASPICSNRRRYERHNPLRCSDLSALSNGAELIASWCHEIADSISL